MALTSKILVTSLVLSFLLLHVVDADDDQQKTPAHASISQTQSSLLQQIDCNGACEARCRLSSRPRLCHRACGTCCKRCNCVPPGTAGNQEVCPCYANMTTHGGKRKCP